MSVTPPDDLPDELPDDEPDDELDEIAAQDEDSAPRGPYTSEHPLEFIVPEPILLRIERVDRPGAEPGHQPVAFSRAGPGEVLLAVNAYPKWLVDGFFASDAFGEPVIVLGRAWEEEGGVRAVLSVLLSERTLRAIQDESFPDDEEGEQREAWAASASPTFEEVMGTSEDEDEDDEEDADDEEGDEEEEAYPPSALAIGTVLRFPENRRFPTDFELEVDDLMRAILEGRAMDAAEKRIDNLLGGI